jgi:hypothetical protein
MFKILFFFIDFLKNQKSTDFETDFTRKLKGQLGLDNPEAQTSLGTRHRMWTNKTKIKI